jgi:trans-aconitate methyltransferase
MQNDKTPYPKFDHDEYARSCAPDDFLGQTRRTVQGKPVSDEQIKMIVETITSRLEMKPDDTLLELACGNGSISRFLFNSCADYLGVDFSEYLISVAKKNFERLPHYQFILQGAAEYVRQEQHPERFSKALCYASFCYFPAADAAEVLRTLFEKFTNVQTVFVGNLPDRDRAGEFYKTRQPSADELSDHSTAIGTWRTRSEFAQLAGDAGWKVQFSTMPPEFFSSYYRFDALLSR